MCNLPYCFGNKKSITDFSKGKGSMACGQCKFRYDCKDEAVIFSSKKRVGRKI